MEGAGPAGEPPHRLTVLPMRGQALVASGPATMVFRGTKSQRKTVVEFLPLVSSTAREHKNESIAPLSHRGSSRVTAISNVIPAISTWPKRAMVNSICSLVSICLIPNPIDQNPWAHWRSPMDMMRQG